jgi:Protein of unknown function (DUF3892)
MADVIVTCIKKQPRSDPYHGITHLGGPGGGGWRWTREQVIASIKSQTNTFFTQVGGKRADIRIAHGPAGEYLRTETDGVPDDNLLALPECQ